MFLKQDKGNDGPMAGTGPVRYLDGTPLARPQTLSKAQMALAGVLVAAAAVIGVALASGIIDNVIHAADREQASVEQNLARGVSLDLPVLTSYIQMDDGSIKQALTDAGYVVYETTTAEEYPDGGFDLYKLPSDVSLEQAAALYAQGVASLSASDAALLLNGSWRMTVARQDYTDMRVRYADFSSGSVEAAVANAIAAEGLSGAAIAESGTDESGNTYQSGTVDVDGTTYAWRVSAIALSSVYDISGLPETAVYVGVRLTPQA